MAARIRKYPRDSPADWLQRGLDSVAEPDQAEQLACIRQLRERLEEAENQIVFNMRLSGASWQQIADATEMKSRQAAQFRYEQSAGLLDKLSAARGRSVEP